MNGVCIVSPKVPLGGAEKCQGGHPRKRGKLSVSKQPLTEAVSLITALVRPRGNVGAGR